MIDVGIGQIQKQRNFHEFCVYHNNMTIKLPHTYMPLFLTLFKFFWVDLGYGTEDAEGTERCFFLRVLCALCGFPNPLQGIIKSLLFFNQFLDGLFKFCDLIFQTEKIILRCDL